MQAILTRRQTKVVLSSIQKLICLYNDHRDSEVSTLTLAGFFNLFSESDFRLLESLFNTFEQSQGVTFCLEGKKLNHKP